MAPRGRGGKFSKPSRGGGKNFSREIVGSDKDGMGMWRDPNDEIAPSSDEDSSSENESSEEFSEEESKPGKSSTAGEQTREERRAVAKAKKAAAQKKRNQGPAQPGDLPPSDSEPETDDDMPANPNHTAKSRSQAQKTAVESDDTPRPNESTEKPDMSQLSRREREALQAQQARDRYQKLHAEGKTDQAKSDLKRLADVRKRREEARLRNEAEKKEEEERKKERDLYMKRHDTGNMPGFRKRGGKKK